MLRFITILIHTFVRAIFVLALAVCACAAAEPTLARLSFWIPSERMAQFEAIYETQVVPILEKHGMRASSEQGRATVDSVFARLFEFEGTGELSEKGRALEEDPTWRRLRQELGGRYGTSETLIPARFGLYAAPAIGKQVPAGSGKTKPAGQGRGHWRIYDATDGLGHGLVESILQDREGNLWFGTGGGASRFDGQRFRRFTTEDGLAYNWMKPMLQDREGNFWFGTSRGVSRYDGTAWTTFSTDNGLKHNYSHSILQDREGNLWFGTMGCGAPSRGGAGDGSGIRL